MIIKSLIKLRKSFLIIALCIASLHLSLFSQCGAGSTITLTSQTEVDNFIANYCTSFSGQLKIIDNNDGIDNIVDLLPLQSLTFVGNGLIIQNNSALISINGFSNLLNINGHLLLSDNPNLQDINGFNILSSISKHFYISYNQALLTVNAFHNLTNVGWNLNITNVPLLNQIIGFTNLSSIGFEFAIDNTYLSDISNFYSLNQANLIRFSNNNNLITINGFNNLTNSNIQINISNNLALQSIIGFQNLLQTGSLDISYNDNLELLNAFTLVSKINGSLYLNSNKKVQNYNSFSFLTRINESLEIKDNRTIKNIFSFNNLQRVNGRVVISNNDSLEIINLNLLDTIEHFLTIASNKRLKTIDGFNSLNRIGSYITVNLNDSLKILSGFNEVGTIKEQVYIGNNNSLRKIEGFQNLDSIKKSLNIINNLKLDTLLAFGSLHYIMEWLEVTGNLKLADCCIFYNILNEEINNGGYAIAGPINIFNNKVNCNSASQILTNCEPQVLGCTDYLAHNYDSDANTDDGSCETCSDGIQNGDEEAIDCGGSICSPCQPPIIFCQTKTIYYDQNGIATFGLIDNLPYTLIYSANGVDTVIVEIFDEATSTPHSNTFTLSEINTDFYFKIKVIDNAGLFTYCLGTINLIQLITFQIGDRVWQDLDYNGIQNGGEPGIGNVNINLSGIALNGALFNKDTFTNANGQYKFLNVLQGNYTITFTMPSGYIVTHQDIGIDHIDSDIDANGQIQISLTNNVNNFSFDAGFYQPTSIGDFVWEDINGNGIQDIGEQGIASVYISITGTTTNGSNVFFNTTTDINGYYLFNNLAPGNYILYFNKPNDYAFSPKDATNDDNDNDANSIGITSIINLSVGQKLANIDAGMYLSLPIRYVKQVSSGIGNGSSWANASSDPQAMINAPGVQEVWIAEGNYKPTQDAFGSCNPTDPRTKTFYIKDGVKMYGGFVGNETSTEDRNISVHETILSGDFNGDDVVTGTGTTLLITNNEENASNVMLVYNSSNHDIYVTIDGFTIKGGNGISSGGGILVYSGNTIIKNNTITGNSAVLGGGIYSQSANNQITNNTIKENLAGHGGGIYVELGSIEITNNAISGNNAINGNGVAGAGGGIYSIENSIEITNNIINGNNAEFAGGGIMLRLGFNSNINNNTIIGNSSNFGGGLSPSGGSDIIVNNIIYNNTGNPKSIYNPYSSSNFTLKNNIIEGGYANCQNCPGGNGNVDPKFVNNSDPDGADNIWSNADDGLKLMPNSPAINAGDPTVTTPVTDITGYSRLGVFDIGAYEYLAPVAKCFSITKTITVGPSNLLYNGPGTMDVYFVDLETLDNNSLSAVLPTKEIARTAFPVSSSSSSNSTFNWTKLGACEDVITTGNLTNEDKGFSWETCLPVTPSDFNKVRTYKLKLNDQFGTSTCTDGKYKIIYSSSTNPETININENDFLSVDENESLLVYPNPGNNNLNIELNIDFKNLEEYSLKIYDIFGREVKSINSIQSSILTIDTGNLMSGTYNLVLKSPEATTTKMWIKM